MAKESLSGLQAARRLAWDAFRAQNCANHDLVHANRVMAEALLLAMGETQCCFEVHCQDDELQAWFCVAIATVEGCGNSEFKSDVIEVPGIGEECHCETQVLPMRPREMLLTIV